MMVVAALVCAWCLVGGASNADAGDIPAEVAPVEEQKLSILIAPYIPIYLQLDSIVDPFPDDFDPSVVEYAIRKHFREQPYFHTPLSAEQILTELNDNLQPFGRALNNMKILTNDGAQYLSSLNLKQAKRKLEASLEGSLEVFAEHLDRTHLANVYKLLAFTWLDISDQATDVGKREEALEHAVSNFTELVRLDPGDVIGSATQPAQRVDAYNEARANFFAAPQETRRVMDSQVMELAETFGGDFALSARMVQSAAGALILELEIYRMPEDDDDSIPVLVLKESVELPLNNEEAIERTDALLSRFSSFVVPKPAPEVEPYSDVGTGYLDANFAYYQFLEGPTSQTFENFGFTLTGTWVATDLLGVMARFTMLFSQDDSEGDLLSSFTTFRTIAGISITKRIPYARFFGTFGLEVTKPTLFSSTNNIDCKVYGSDDPLCPEDAVSSYDLPVLVGLNVGVGINICTESDTGTAFCGHVGSTLSYYFLPTDEDIVINLPIGFEVGIGLALF